jgi:phosphoglycolate phosphatase
MKSTDLEKIKGIIFDFDGTLAVLNIDFFLMKTMVFSLFAEYGVNPDVIQQTYLLEIIDEVDLALRRRDPASAERFYRAAHSILHGIELKAAEEGRLIDCTRETLERLRCCGIKVGIVTRNCEAAVRKVFPAISEFCDAFVPRDATRRVKPDPAHLYSAIDALGIAADQAVMVGDHTIDIQAGKSAGMLTVGVLTGRVERVEFEKAGADYVLADVSELCPLLSC